MRRRAIVYCTLLTKFAPMVVAPADAVAISGGDVPKDLAASCKDMARERVIASPGLRLFQTPKPPATEIVWPVT